MSVNSHRAQSIEHRAWSIEHKVRISNFEFERQRSEVGGQQKACREDSENN